MLQDGFKLDLYQLLPVELQQIWCLTFVDRQGI